MSAQSINWVILPGLPGTGPDARQFSLPGGSTHREGLVLEFHPQPGESWVANFQRGSTITDGVWLHPDEHQLLVIAGGQGYLFDSASKSVVEYFGGWITIVIPASSQGTVLFGDGRGFWGFSNGHAWESRPISRSKVRNLRLSGPTLTGEAWAYHAIDRERWLAFELDIDTGRHCGGDPYAHVLPSRD